MHKRGFAIVVVLFGLSVVTALFAISTTLTLSSITRNNTDQRLALGASNRYGLIEAASVMATFDQPVSILEISGTTLEIREVSGLVDLNSASRHLLELFFEKSGLSVDQFDVFLKWRSEGRRLLRLEDLGRLVGTSDLDVDLFRVATIYSGKQGVAPEGATEDLVKLMGWTQAGIPDPFRAPLGEAVFAVYNVNTSGEAEYLGTISRMRGKSVILELR